MKEVQNLNKNVVPGEKIGKSSQPFSSLANQKLF